ncbi:hypothetical protein HK105_208752 [Polyrhizophydium stewartii]|uniref:G-protein coupled receptors family 3 profile domain-containing protein n=1 Tax=Polyrhizophydium stewartii TaxID=2732419 RepID=A0ABR4MX02_9FUNG
MHHIVSRSTTRQDTPLDASLFRGVFCVWSFLAPNPADPYYAAFFPRFQTFATWTIANQAGLYYNINFGQTDSRQQDYPRNFFYGDPPTDSVPSTYVTGAYDVTRALAYTLEQVSDATLRRSRMASVLTSVGNQIIVDAQTTGAALANGSLASAITLAKLTKDYTTKPMLVTIPAFTPQGDPLPNPLIIVELQGKSFTDVYDTVASVSLDPVTGNGNMTIDKSKFFWNGNRSLSDVPIDSMPDKEDFVKTSDTIVVVMLAIAALVALACLAAALFVIVKEKSQFIRLFSPRLLAGISIGLALMQVNSFLLVGKNKPVGCALRPWPVPVGVSVVLASIVAKNLRIISVFAFSMSRMLSLFDRLKKIHIIAIHTVLILVPMILLAVVTAISPMTSDAVYANWLDGYQYTCVASAAVNVAVAAVVVWIALLMIGTWVLCYLNSGLPDAYNDTIESAGSAAIILLLGALAFLAGASPATATSAFALETVCTAVAGVTVLMLMLGKPVMNCIVEEILGGRRVNKAARVRTKRSSRSSTHSASSHSQVTSVTSDSSFKVSKSSVAAINPKSSEIASDKQGPERHATLETEAMSQEVQIDISRHRISIAIHATMLDTELLPQWRAAAIHLFPTPVMMIRVSTNRASKAIDAIEYLPFAELTGFKLRTNEPNVGQCMCTLHFGRRTITLCFASPLKAQAWAALLGRALVACAGQRDKLKDTHIVTSLTLQDQAFSHLDASPGFLDAMLVAMAVGALVFAVGAQTRPSNKTANAVNIGFLDVGNVVTADQFYFGMLMAGNEINANATILQDVTLTFPRIRMQSATTRPAAVYDSVASLCDSGQYRAFLCSINTNNTLTYSYPLFYRSQTPLTPNILTMIAMFRYFGWKKTGIVYGASGLYPETNDASKQMFPAYGIQVLTSIKIPDYDSTISTLYYPQIKAQFDFLAQTKLRIFCAYFDTAVVLDVAMAANRTGLIGRDYDTPLDAKLLSGFLVPSFSTAPNPADPYYAAFFPRFQTFATWTIANQAGLYRDINFGQTDSRQQDYPRNFFYGDPPTDSIPAQSVIFAYDVTRALAYTLEQIIVDAQTTGAALANGSLASAITLAKLTKDYTTKPMLVTIPAFTPQGDPLPNPLIIVELQGKSFTDVYDTVASVSLDPVTGNGNMTIDKSKFFWNGNRSLSDVPIDSMPDKEDFVKTSDTIVVVMLAIAALVALACLAAALFVIVKEKSQFIRLFSPRLLAGISIGLALMQVNSFLLVGKNKPVGCALRPWPVPVGVSVVLASIVAKNLRIISVFAFSMSRMLSLFDRLKKIHIIAIHTILLAVVTAISPMTSDAVYANWLDGYQYTCVASAAVNAAVAAVVVWIALLMIGTWVLCYLNSGLPDAYNDTIESAGSAAIILLLGALAFLAGASPATATSAFALEMVCTAVAGVTVLMLMLGKPVMNCIVEEILGGRRVNKAARVRTKRSSRSGGHSASSHSQVTSVTSDSSFKVSKSSVAAINPKSSEIASDKQGPERQATLETEAMSQEVQIDISRHRISIAIHAMMLDTELLPQWRAAAIHLFPTPVMMIRVSTNRASKAIDAIEYLPFAELTGFKLRTDEPNVGQCMCALHFGRRTITLCFASPFKAQAWAALLGRALVACAGQRDMLKDTHIVTSLTLQDQAPLAQEKERWIKMSIATLPIATCHGQVPPMSGKPDVDGPQPVESKALVVRQPHPAWASVTRLLRSTSLDDNTKARLAAGKLHRGELLKLLSSAAASARANRSICDDDIERIMDDVGDGLFALRGRIMDERLSAEAGDGTPSDDKQGSLVRTNPAQEQMFRTVKSALKGSAESRESAIAMLDVLVKQVDRGLWVPKFNQIEDTINDTSTLAEFVGILAKRRDAKSTGVRAVTRFLTANRLVIASTVVSVARAATEIAPIPGLSAALGILNEIIQSMNEGWDAQRIMQAISARVNEVKEIILANMRRV